MKNFYKKILVSTGLFLLFFVLTFNSFAQEPPAVETIWSYTSVDSPHTRTSLVFPTNPPDSTQVEGGYFNSYFNNMFSNLCPDGEVLAGFNPGAIDDSSPYKINTRGKLVCKSISSSDGLASGFTGSMIGVDGSIPVYSSGGTVLSGSFLSQNASNLLIKFPNLDKNINNTFGSIYFKDKNNNNVAYIGDGSTSSNNFQFFSIDSGLQLGIASGSNSTGTYLNFSNINGELTARGTGLANSARFNVLGKIKMVDGSQGSGKVLTSDANGLATWKTPSEIFGNINLNNFFASSFTGELVGSGNVLPVYTANGQGLRNSIVSQTYENNQNGIKVDGTLTVNQDDDNSAFVAHFGRKNSANQFQGLSIFSYVPDRNRNSNLANNEFLSGASMLYSGLASKNFHITSADENSEMRFVVGNFSDPNKVKLKLTKNGLIYPQGAGSGKILVSDANGLARWETASLGGNPNDCSATNKSVNGHNYPIIGLTNGNSFLSNYIETITGGSRQYSQRFKCEKGYIITEGSEVNSLVCNNGYISNGSACIRPSNDSKLGCSAMTMNINGREYSVPAIAHNFSAYVYSSSNIDNGHINYKQLFACNNGTITTSGTEEATSTTCSAGFGWNGNSCILSNNIEVTHAYSGTTCNTANIQVVNITPGIDKIPENLNADTMYKLEGGVYDITKKVNFNNCSAIVGAGTGATTVQYAGLSYGSEDLMNITKSDAIIDGLKIVGTKEGAGKVANVIRIKGTSSRDGKLKNIVIRNADIQQATNAGINTEYVEYSNFEGLLISNISSSSYSYGINLSSSNNNNFTDITISNISSSSYSYGINLSSSNNNNFTDITISNISSSSSYSYGINLYGSNNNNFTDITISNISSSYSSSSSHYGINLSSSNNNNFTDITISNTSSFSSSSGINLSSSNNNNFTNITITNTSSRTYSYGINLYSSNNNNFTNVTISNIYSSSYYDSSGINLSSSNNNNFTNITISNIYSSSFGINLGGSNIALNNISISNSNKIGLNISGNNNTIRNLISYKNKQDGINVTGSNNTFSNVYSYANGGAGIAGNGNSNFYYDKLQVFGNGGTNNVGPLNRGLASHWLSGFNDGNFSDNSSFSTNWAISPTNVSGFNVNTVGYQTGLTWPDKVDWSFGSSIPNQISPIIPSACNISTNSTTKCRPEFGGTDTYNSLKKIGEW